MKKTIIPYKNQLSENHHATLKSCYVIFFFFCKRKEQPSLSGFTIVAPENIYYNHSAIMAGNILVWKNLFPANFQCGCACVRANQFTSWAMSQPIVFYYSCSTVSPFRVLQFYERNHKWAVQRVTTGDRESPTLSTSAKRGARTHWSSSNPDVLWFYDSILLVHLPQHWDPSSHPQTQQLLFLRSAGLLQANMATRHLPISTARFLVQSTRGYSQHFASHLVLQAECLGYKVTKNRSPPFTITNFTERGKGCRQHTI